MLTICWAAKGGSGTTVFATALALAATTPTLLVDLAGDVMTTLGLPDPDGPGIHDWLASDSPTDRLPRLEQSVADHLTVLAAGHDSTDRPARLDQPVADHLAVPAAGHDSTDRRARWFELGAHLRAESRRVVVDAGTGRPPDPLVAAADETLLVTRPCYLSLRRAIAAGVVPTGVVLVDEPGRALRSGDIERSLGVPVVSTALLDPAIARAVDAGLLTSRLPGAWRRQLRRAA